MDLYWWFALFKHSLYKYHLAEIPGLYGRAAFYVAYLCLVSNTCVYIFKRENIWQANARLDDDCLRGVFAGGLRTDVRALLLTGSHLWMYILIVALKDAA